MNKNPKIVVFKLKELIYTGIFILSGILLIILFVWMFRSGKTRATATSSVPETTASIEERITGKVSEEETTTDNMAGWRTYNNNTSNKYAVDGTTKVYYVSGTADSKVTLTEISGGVPANTIVILHQTNGTNTMTLTKDDDATAVTPGSNELQVTTTTTDLSAGVYRLGYKSGEGKGIGFYKYANASAPAGIIYLTSINAAHEFLGLDFDGETTGVNEVTNTNLTNNTNEFYNLAGQRVAQPTKGLYIVNGRKVIIK